MTRTSREAILLDLMPLLLPTHPYWYSELLWSSSNEAVETPIGILRRLPVLRRAPCSVQLITAMED